MIDIRGINKNISIFLFLATIVLGEMTCHGQKSELMRYSSPKDPFHSDILYIKDRLRKFGQIRLDKLADIEKGMAAYRLIVISGCVFAS